MYQVALRPKQLSHIWFISLYAGSVLCVGSEWHRFPSSFFVPGFVEQVRWIDDGFRGLLPFPFNSTLGGTAAAPPYFNNKNIVSNEQYVCTLLTRHLYLHLWEGVWLPFIWQLHNIDMCSFLVELQLKRPYLTLGSNLSTWEVQAMIEVSFISFKTFLFFIFNCEYHICLCFQPIAALPYLDRELSPAKYRSFFIPYLWQERNVFGMYKLLRRIPKWFGDWICL